MLNKGLNLVPTFTVPAFTQSVDLFKFTTRCLKLKAFFSYKPGNKTKDTMLSALKSKLGAKSNFVPPGNIHLLIHLSLLLH